jgi:hypothetical protein
LEEGFVFFQCWTHLREIFREGHNFTVIFDILIDVKDLLHFVEQFVVFILHLPSRRGVDSHCLVVVDEVIDFEAVRFFNFSLSMRNDLSHCEEEPEQLDK